MSSVLERLRTRKRVVASGLLPLLAAVWATSAGACAAMTAAGAEGSADATAVAAEEGAGRHEHSASAHGAHVAHAHEAAVTQGAEAAGAHDDGASGGEPHEHGACPHCVADSSGAPAEAEHLACALVDESSDANRAVASQWDAKAPAVAVLVGRLFPLEPAPDSVVDRYGGLFPSSVSLHLRNCVFLI